MKRFKSMRIQAKFTFVYSLSEICRNLWFQFLILIMFPIKFLDNVFLLIEWKAKDPAGKRVYSWNEASLTILFNLRIFSLQVIIDDLLSDCREFLVYIWIFEFFC